MSALLPAVHLQQVTKRFTRSAPILADITLDIPVGTITHIRGGNGSGKSTLLALIVGLTRPTSGTITKAARHAAFVPERGNVGAGLTVEQYLRHMQALTRQRVHGKSRQRIEELLDRYGLSAHAQAQIDQLSKGTLRKVTIAQALLDDRDLLVMDEPDDGLDANSLHRLREDLTTAAARGAAVVLTSHTDHFDQLDAPARTIHLHHASAEFADRPPGHTQPPATWDLVRVELLDRLTGTHKIHIEPRITLNDFLLEAITSGQDIWSMTPADDANRSKR